MAAPNRPVPGRSQARARTRCSKRRVIRKAGSSEQARTPVMVMKLNGRHGAWWTRVAPAAALLLAAVERAGADVPRPT